MKPQKIFAASALLILSSLAAFTFRPQDACAGGRCGSCYNTGRPGFVVTRGGIQDCVPCNHADMYTRLGYQPPADIGHPKEPEAGEVVK